VIPEKEAAQELKVRIQALREDPALKGHPLMAELERLAEEHQRLLRRMVKISRISDAFQSQMKELNESLQVLSRTDFLTGLTNRRSMMEALHSELGRARRSGEPLALLLCDVDRFKAINDTYGHAVGDEVLKTLAQVLRASLRGYDVCARWGGEEFLVLLPRTGLQGAREAAEKLRKGASGGEVRSGGHLLRVTLSVGLAEMGPEESLDSLIHRADSAMYEAKRKGGDRVEADQNR
jgi:diguanylate cyclase (GGDEF)-like protein